MSTPLLPYLSDEISHLTLEQQGEVLQFVRTLKATSSDEQRKAAILELAGSISPEDLEIMKQAIEEGCEQVDPDGW